MRRNKPQHAWVVGRERTPNELGGGRRPDKRLHAAARGIPRFSGPAVLVETERLLELLLWDRAQVKSASSIARASGSTVVFERHTAISSPSKRHSAACRATSSRVRSAHRPSTG